MNIYEIQQRILEFAPDAPDEWDWMDAEDEEPEYEVRMYFFGSLGSAFFFCRFLGFWSTYRETIDLFSTALEICYMIATRISKIDLEIAQIFEVKVGTHHLEIDILVLQ